jgi:hypothetical protein
MFTAAAYHLLYTLRICFHQVQLKFFFTRSRLAKSYYNQICSGDTLCTEDSGQWAMGSVQWTGGGGTVDSEK